MNLEVIHQVHILVPIQATVDSGTLLAVLTVQGPIPIKRIVTEIRLSGEPIEYQVTHHCVLLSNSNVLIIFFECPLVQILRPIHPAPLWLIL